MVSRVVRGIWDQVFISEANSQEKNLFERGKTKNGFTFKWFITKTEELNQQ